MKEINYIPIEKKSLNDKLVNLYGSRLSGLYNAVEPLFKDKDAIKPALPLLIEINDENAWEKADLRIMIFGRETNNWNADENDRPGCPFGTYNFNLSTSEDILDEIRGKHIDGQPEIFGLGDIYHTYCYEDNGVGKTVFTKRMNELIGQIKDRFSNTKIETVWNNVSKIGCGGKSFGKCCRKPTAQIHEIEREHFNVVAEEVKILKPDIIIFLTGFGADNEIKEIFNLTENNFQPVKEGVFLDRIEIPEVKYAARTIHPARKSNEELKNHFDALVEDISTVIK